MKLFEHFSMLVVYFLSRTNQGCLAFDIELSHSIQMYCAALKAILGHACGHLCPSNFLCQILSLVKPFKMAHFSQILPGPELSPDLTVCLKSPAGYTCTCWFLLFNLIITFLMSIPLTREKNHAQVSLFPKPYCLFWFNIRNQVSNFPASRPSPNEFLVQ